MTGRVITRSKPRARVSTYRSGGAKDKAVYFGKSGRMIHEAL
jgi:hypothetical protein